MIRLILVALSGLLAATQARAQVPAGRTQFALTAGVVGPAEFTPEIIFPTHTGIGPALRFESTYSPVPFLEIGGYLSYSSHPVTSIDGFPAYDNSGSIGLLSGGGVFKARFALTASLTLRAGLEVGLNAVSAYIPHTTGGESMPGRGLALGALIDLRFLTGPQWALVAQTGFVCQPFGSATFPTDTDRSGLNVSFGFLPATFLTVGPEFRFGP